MVLSLFNAIQQATRQVSQLDAEILLMHVLKISRAYLYAYPENNLTTQQEKDFIELIKKRQQGQPIAYLTGHREFWSLDLIVTPDVLIPRHETELLVELVIKNNQQENINLLDLGTGSGAIALAIATEKPSWRIHAVDVSEAALAVAKKNAERLAIPNIIFYQGEWFAALPGREANKFNIIVSNPPYISEDDVYLRQGDLRFEPRGALVAEDDGLQDFSNIILQAKNYLIPGGVVMLEHGFEQAIKVASIFEKAGYTDVKTYQDLSGLDRVTIASWVGF